MRRHAKLAAVLVVVMLALTGFSNSHTTGKGGKGGKSRSKSGGGGGGGCSNSKKSNGGYHDYDDDDYGSSGSSVSSGSDSYTGAPTPTDSATAAARAYVVDCVNKARGKRKADTSATVKVVAEAGASHRYEVDVVFLNAGGDVVDRGYTDVTLDGGETRTVQVRMQSPTSVARVSKCEAQARSDD
ncbi:hypothetical protein FBY35_6807 [Streptomyces sp. SLBN-118]|uniref:hypothetical protein n=1 Tax=Streptomyces sp. SLBN-118 TaxID=2768454 RepID=UPI00117339F7|nr:hypothetical protein FBY35_6807 [Streptomyces sp. SLBN-118]